MSESGRKVRKRIWKQDRLSHRIDAIKITRWKLLLKPYPLSGAQQCSPVHASRPSLCAAPFPLLQTASPPLWAWQIFSLPLQASTSECFLFRSPSPQDGLLRLLSYQCFCDTLPLAVNQNLLDILSIYMSMPLDWSFLKRMKLVFFFLHFQGLAE